MDSSVVPGTSNSLRRGLRWLRPILLIGAIAAWLALAFNLGGIFLALAPLATIPLPLLWPSVFGRWTTLLILLVAILAPPLITAAAWPALDQTNPFVAAGVMLFSLAAWLMLPATVGLVIWRRFASIPIMLLGIALAPPASLLIVLLDLQSRGEAAGQSGSAATFMRLFAATTPMWFVTLACCLGPLFFVGILMWLIYREVTFGDTPRPPANPPVLR